MIQRNLKDKKKVFAQRKKIAVQHFFETEISKDSQNQTWDWMEMFENCGWNEQLKSFCMIRTILQDPFAYSQCNEW